MKSGILALDGNSRSVSILYEGLRNLGLKDVDVNEKSASGRNLYSALYAMDPAVSASLITLMGVMIPFVVQEFRRCQDEGLCEIIMDSRSNITKVTWKGSPKKAVDLVKNLQRMNRR